MKLSDQIQESLASLTNAPAIEFRGQWHDWKAIGALADRLGTLLAAAGVVPGARIALVARNRPAHVGALFFLLAKRFRTVMVYAFQPGAELAEDLTSLSVAAVIADQEDWSEPVMAAMRAIGRPGITLAPGLELPVLAVSGEVAKTAPPAEDDGVAIEMLTSGTTGKPKRIPISFFTLEKAVETMISVGTGQAPDIISFPIGNISGLYYLVACGAKHLPVVLLEKFLLSDWLDAVGRHRPIYCAVPPAAVSMMLDAGIDPAALSGLVAIGTGAAPLDADLQAAFEQRFGVAVLPAYGATEFGGVVTAWTLEDHQQFGAGKRGSVGRSRPGVRLRVLDQVTLAPLGVGQVGILSAQVERVGPDWMQTTDLALFDADGFVFLHGRADEVINRGGFKIAPQQLESTLRTHPSVVDVAVVGRADPRLGEVPVAVLELRPGFQAPSRENFDVWARARMRPQEVPVHYLFVDALPRTASYKVARGVVRRLVGEAEQ